MKTRHKSIYLVVFYLLNTFLMSAQKPASLPHDPAMKSSVFPNGLSCYVVENRSEKGLADFALIRRDYDGHEVVCAVEGRMVGKETALDSTLLQLMRRVSADSIPADQAIIASGDLDASSVISRLRYMSLMIDRSDPSALPEYKWNGDGKMRHSCYADTLTGLAAVCFEWNAPRAPAEYMNTVQSAVYDKAVSEIGDVACRRIRRVLRASDIPVADVSYHYTGSMEGLADERHELKVTMNAADSSRVRSAVLSVLSAIDRGTTSDDDIALAENAYMLGLERKAADVVRRNSDYVKICTDAFLYNGPLSTDRERLAYFRSKDISESSRRAIFNGIAAALIDVETPSDTIDDPLLNLMSADTLSLPAATEKIKVRSSKKDPFSGGTIWTFANGFKVIYKQMPTDRVIYYSMSLNGGYGNLEDLKRGEGAYLSDYDDLCWISGMKARYFKDLLALSGMTMDARVGMFNTSVSGKVQDRNADLMMKALLAFANERRPDGDEISYYRTSEGMRRSFLRGKDVRIVIDSLMCPEYRYSPYKSAEDLDDDTIEKAEALYSGMTSKMNDGVLVIVGDMDPSRLKKLLQVYVGGFNVKQVASRRPSHKYQPVSGVSTYYADGSADEIIMTLSSRMPMTAENHMAVEIAAMILERDLKEKYAASGLDISLFYDRRIYPDERFSFMIRLSGASGAAELYQLREALSECFVKDIDAEVLRCCREYVKHKYSLMMTTPEYWLGVIPLRHMEGKDYTSGYAAKADAVSAERIKAVFDALETGAGIEYVISQN